MARRRYQTGSLQKRDGWWTIRVREDVVIGGKVERLQRRYGKLVSLKECPTKRLAKRHPVVRKLLNAFQGPECRPQSDVTFGDYAASWVTTTLQTYKPSTRSVFHSQLNSHVLPELAEERMIMIDRKRIKLLIAKWHRTDKLAPKTVKNLVALVRLIWHDAQDDGDLSPDTDPFRNLKLPEIIPAEQPCFTPEQIRKIVAASDEPYKTIWALLAETGMRRGEVCALECGAVDCENRTIVIRKSAFGKIVGTTKARKPRAFALSPQMAAKLKMYVDGMPPGAPVFLNSRGKPLHPDNLVDRHLTPVVERLGFKGGCHAFRHGNATLMDSKVKPPMAVRQSRLGHVDETTTMNYTHLVGADDHSAASAIYSAIFPEE